MRECACNPEVFIIGKTRARVLIAVNYCRPTPNFQANFTFRYTHCGRLGVPWQRTCFAGDLA